MALLVVLSVMSGFREDLQKKILGANSHAIVLSYTGSIKDYQPPIGEGEGRAGCGECFPVCARTGAYICREECARRLS